MFTYAGLLVLLGLQLRVILRLLKNVAHYFLKAEGDTVPLLTLSAQQSKTQRYSVDHVRQKKATNLCN